MATLKSMPFPRWLEPMSGELEGDLSTHGVEQAQQIGQALTAFLTRKMADYETNNEFITEEVLNSDSSVESHTHDGSGSATVNHTDLTSRPYEVLLVPTDEDTAISSTGTKLTFRMPHALTLAEVRASLTSACASGTFTVDINEGGTTVLSTKLTIDATETTSTTAATAPVISDSSLADDAEITLDVDDTGDGTATGLKVWLIGTRS